MKRENVGSGIASNEDGIASVEADCRRRCGSRAAVLGLVADYGAQRARVGVAHCAQLLAGESRRTTGGARAEARALEALL